MTLDAVKVSPGRHVARLIDWMNVTFHGVFALIGTVIEAALNACEAALQALPPLALMAVVGVLVGVLVGIRPAVLAVACLAFCYLIGFWTASMQTIALVSIAVVISVAIAFPLGVLTSRRPGLEAAIRPVLDIMQTVPPWVYMIPAVMIFSLGRVPAIIATITYGIPPMLRLTTLALKQVPRDLLELGRAIGARPLTILARIELPSAKPTLLVGLNQCILLCLAMVVLAGLVGAGGLGAEVTRGLTRMEMGLGLRAGLAIVAIAILLDRVSRAALQRS